MSNHVRAVEADRIDRRRARGLAPRVRTPVAASVAVSVVSRSRCILSNAVIWRRMSEGFKYFMLSAREGMLFGRVLYWIVGTAEMCGAQE